MLGIRCRSLWSDDCRVLWYLCRKWSCSGDVRVDIQGEVEWIMHVAEADLVVRDDASVS